MNYAVIATGGKQYRVSEGDVIEIDRLGEKETEKVTFENTLLLVNDDKIEIGKPYLTGVKVIGKVVKELRGDKIRVSKFKAKSRHRRTTGFRASLSRVQIEKIEFPGKPAVKKEPAKTKVKEKVKK